MRSTDGSVHIHHPSGEVMPSACWQLILSSDKWLPFWLCWKPKVLLSIKRCYLNYCLLLLWCEKRKKSVDCKDPFPAEMKVRRIGCKLRGHLWSLLAIDPGVAKRHLHSITGTMLIQRGSARASKVMGFLWEERRANEGSHKEMAGEPRKNESVNSNFPLAFVMHKTIRWHLRLSPSRAVKNNTAFSRICRRFTD